MRAASDTSNATPQVSVSSRAFVVCSSSKAKPIAFDPF